MKKILIALLSIVCFIGFGGKVSAAGKTVVSLGPRFDTSQIPTKVIVGTSGKFSAPYSWDTEGYDLDVETIFSVTDPSILAVSKNGEWQALKTGTVTLCYTYKVSQDSLDKYPDVEFIHQETAVEGTTIEVTPGAAIVTPPVTSQSIPTTNDPAVTTATPSITAKATSTAAPTGAVAKTNHKAKDNTSVAAALLIMSVLTILGTISYKRRENV